MPSWSPPNAKGRPRENGTALGGQSEDRVAVGIVFAQQRLDLQPQLRIIGAGVLEEAAPCLRLEVAGCHEELTYALVLLGVHDACSSRGAPTVLDRHVGAGGTPNSKRKPSATGAKRRRLCTAVEALQISHR